MISELSWHAMLRNALLVVAIILVAIYVFRYYGTIDYREECQCELVDINTFQRTGTFQYIIDSVKYSTVESYHLGLFSYIGEQFHCYYDSDYPNEVFIDYSKPIVPADEVFDSVQVYVYRYEADISYCSDRRNVGLITYAYNVEGKEYTRNQLISKLNIDNIMSDNNRLYIALYNVKNPNWSYIMDFGDKIDVKYNN